MYLYTSGSIHHSLDSGVCNSLLYWDTGASNTPQSRSVTIKYAKLKN